MTSHKSTRKTPAAPEVQKEEVAQTAQVVQAEQPKEPTIVLSLSVPAVQAILAGLGKLPLETVKPLYDGIVQAAEQQLQQQQEQPKS